VRRDARAGVNRLYRLAPPAFLAAYTFFFKQGAKLDEAA
jgi:transcription-repair coupling factor (superfamily II helicase)